MKERNEFLFYFFKSLLKELRVDALFLVIEDSRYDNSGRKWKFIFPYMSLLFLLSSVFGYWKFLWILRDQYS